MAVRVPFSLGIPPIEFFIVIKVVTDVLRYFDVFRRSEICNFNLDITHGLRLFTALRQSRLGKSSLETHVSWFK